MPEIKINRAYADGDILVETDLNNIHEAVTTLNNTTKYDDYNIQDQAIQTGHIIDASVDTDRIANNAVTSAKIPDSNVTSDKIAANEIKTINIVNAAVTTDKLANEAVNTVKFSTAARLDNSKIVAKYYGATSNSSATTRTNTDVSEATIVSHTVSSTVRNPLILLQPTDTNPAYIRAWQFTNVLGGVVAVIKIKIDGVEVASRAFGSAEGSETGGADLRLPLSSIKMLYSGTINSGSVVSMTLLPPSKYGSSAVNASVTACKLVVLEL